MGYYLQIRVVIALLTTHLPLKPTSVIWTLIEINNELTQIEVL
jgi:hypothetical protein